MPEIRNEEFQVVTLGAVKPDGTPDIANVLFRFPVPHQQMSIRQSVKVDEADIPGRSGKIKQAVGYEDTEITINLTLVDEEDRAGIVTRSAIDQYRELQAAFRDRSDPVGDGQTMKASYAVPTIFSIQSRLTDACGIRTVLFKGLDVSDQPGSTDLEVSIGFSEFEPVAAQVEKRGREAVQKSQATQSWNLGPARATSPTSVARSLEEVFLKRFMEIGTRRSPDPASGHSGEPFSRRVVFDSGRTLSRRKTPIPQSVRSIRAGRECEQEVFFRD